MYEELYIIDNGKRLKVDLATPSGITLNFKSNIFGDLSKITCSYTYTFKLPLTANNRRVFDNADDIRCVSNKIHRRLKAEYIQNGIPLFKNANLYIESTESNFNAVMTWGVIDGFQTLKDDDTSIRNLPFESMATYGPVDSLMSAYKNTDEVVRPLYNAGATYVSVNGNKNVYMSYNFFPLPCVPIHKLIEKINEKYSTKFVLGADYVEGETADIDILFKYGVIPFVNAVQSEELINSHATECFVHTLERDYPAVHGKPNIIHGYAGTAARPMNWDKFSEVRDSEGRLYGLKNNSKSAIEATIKGYFGVTLKYVDGKNAYEITSSSENKPVLKVYCWNPYSGASGVLSELASLDGVYGTNQTDEYGLYGDQDWRWRFRFTEKYCTERLTVTIPAGAIIFFGIECGDRSGIYSAGGESDTFTIYPNQTPEGLPFSSSDRDIDSWQIPIGSNLPDISCLNFMNALYYMIGAFPTVSSNGDIVSVYYDDLRKNIISGIAYEWDRKITSAPNEQAQSITYSINGFAQRSYFLMKNDNLDSKDSEDESDVYASGIGVIECNNQTIEKTKTIIQLPFYGAYLKNLKNQKFSTGDTIKFWVREDKISTKEAKPAVGIITPFPQKNSSQGPTGKVWMGMKIWYGFSKILENPSYLYLSRIMENPIIVKENFLLNELDLRDIDYSRPVYLSKYGAYFAIVSISRDSKGICKCELLKLPEEE